MKKLIVSLGCCMLLANPLYAQLIIQSGGTVSVKGNTTSAVTIQGAGLLELNGTHPQNLNVNGQYIPNLQINNDSDINLTGSAQLSGMLTFSSGDILLNNFNLSLDNSATITGAANTQFVTTNDSGYLIKRGMGATAFQYPIGNTTSTYNPLTLSNTGTTDTLGVRCLASMFSNGLTGTAFTTEVVNASWNITEQTPGAINLSVMPSWYASDELPGFNRTSVTLAHYDTVTSSWDTSNVQTGPASGSNPYTYTRTGINSVGTFAVGTWTSPSPAITSALTATGTVNTAFSYTIIATNNPTSYNATGLPAGLSINTSTGVISGSVATIGNYSVPISATNGFGTTDETLTININPLAPVITSSGTANATTGSAFSYTIIATNNPTSYTATGLAAGLSINTTTGVISGTPTIAGNDTVTLSASNAGGTNSNTLIITITPPTPVITSSSIATAIAGNTFSYTITASSSISSYNATGLPAGLSVNTTTGVISGAPTTTGSYSVTISATNLGGTGTEILTITVNNPAAPVITSATTASDIVDSTFSYSIVASNNPASYNATGLPAGLSVNTTTGVINGTPTTIGSYPITISATNLGGTNAETLTITISNLPAPVITSATMASDIVDSAFSYRIVASNSTASYNATGLPPGLTVNTATGVISGTPSTIGSYLVTISATNVGGTDTETLTITVRNLPAPVITSEFTASSIVDSTFNYAITASNNPVSYSATGLPAGLTVNTSTGIISGAPTTYGVYAATIAATNTGGTDSIILTITIDTLPPISGIVIYPDPVVTGGSLHATLPNWQGLISFSIHSTNGKLVESGTEDIVGGAITLQITNLSQGAYVLRLSNGTTIITREFIVLQP